MTQQENFNKIYPKGCIFNNFTYLCTRKGIYIIKICIFIPERVQYNLLIMNIASFVKERRKQLRLTQPELAMRAGVGLRFVRELEQGKKTLRLDKVNQVLALFGAEVGVVTLVEK